jgi:GGDEF domain-containing protein
MDGIKKLSEYLYRYHNEKVVIILDEYDMPVQEAFFNNYYNEAMSYLRNLLSGALKDNPYLEKGILTYIKDIERGLICHWINTSSNDLIRDIIAKADYKAKIECEELIEGNCIEKKIQYRNERARNRQNFRISYCL